MDTDRNAIITGANRGIGRALVQKYAELGFNIWACARNTNAAFEADMADLAAAKGVWIKPVYFEMTDEAAIKRGFAEIYADKKPVHTLINNAGVGCGNVFQMTTMAQTKELFEINTFAPMYLCQLVLKIMSRQKSGCIINIASVAGLTAYFGHTVYGASKAALISFSKTLSAEVSQYGVRVNAVCPSATDTEMFKDASEDFKQKLIEKSAMGRMATPEEIANVAYFLSSDESYFINGQAIRVDGGGGYER